MGSCPHPQRLLFPGVGGRIRGAPSAPSLEVPREAEPRGPRGCPALDACHPSRCPPPPDPTGVPGTASQFRPCLGTLTLFAPAASPRRHCGLRTARSRDHRLKAKRKHGPTDGPPGGISTGQSLCRTPHHSRAPKWSRSQQFIQLLSHSPEDGKSEVEVRAAGSEALDRTIPCPSQRPAPVSKPRQSWVLSLSSLVLPLLSL